MTSAEAVTFALAAAPISVAIGAQRWPAPIALAMIAVGGYRVRRGGVSIALHGLAAASGSWSCSAFTRMRSRVRNPPGSLEKPDAGGTVFRAPRWA
jgi:hypothetical protein